MRDPHAAMHARCRQLHDDREWEAAQQAWMELAEFEEAHGMWSDAAQSWEGAGLAALNAGESGSAVAMAHRQAHAADQAGDKVDLWRARKALGRALAAHGDHADARRCFTDVLDGSSASSDDEVDWVRLPCLEWMTRCALDDGDVAEARRWFDQLQAEWSELDGADPTYATVVEALRAAVERTGAG